jgi:hypothetical protein
MGRGSEWVGWCVQAERRRESMKKTCESCESNARATLLQGRPCSHSRPGTWVRTQPHSHDSATPHVREHVQVNRYGKQDRDIYLQSVRRLQRHDPLQGTPYGPTFKHLVTTTRLSLDRARISMGDDHEKRRWLGSGGGGSGGGGGGGGRGGRPARSAVRAASGAWEPPTALALTHSRQQNLHNSHTLCCTADYIVQVG